MKKYSSIIYILSVACACMISVGCTTGPGAAMAPPPNSGHVLIYRVANFGERLGLVVSVDGKDVGSFSQGNNYSGYLPAGQHVLIPRPDPNPPETGPPGKTWRVNSGKPNVKTPP